MREYVCTPDMRHRLYKIRTEFKLSQREMAQELGYSSSFYSKIESRGDAKVSLCTIKAICSILHINYDYLVHGQGPMFEVDDPDLRYVIDAYKRLKKPQRDQLVDYTSYLLYKTEKEAREQ